jgi:HSP20 family protein
MGDLDWRAVRELMTLGARLREAAERALLPASPVSIVVPTAFEPPVNVWESDREVTVEAELPGVRSKDIDLRLEGESLVLAGELPLEDGTPPGAYLRLERPRGKFYRVVSLPAEVSGTTSATLRQGVLRVTLPKAGRSRRRVAIAREGV